MAENSNELRGTTSAEAQEKASTLADECPEGMSLDELRQALKQTQQHLAQVQRVKVRE